MADRDFPVVSKYGLDVVLDALVGAGDDAGFEVQRTERPQGVFGLDCNVEVVTFPDAEQYYVLRFTEVDDAGRVLLGHFAGSVQSNIFTIQRERDKK